MPSARLSAVPFDLLAGLLFEPARQQQGARSSSGTPGHQSALVAMRRILTTTTTSSRTTATWSASGSRRRRHASMNSGNSRSANLRWPSSFGWLPSEAVYCWPLGTPGPGSPGRIDDDVQPLAEAREQGVELHPARFHALQAAGSGSWYTARWPRSRAARSVRAGVSPVTTHRRARSPGRA